jgi:cytochrome oxidase Cu insertion factor (SCO1/SenC/PrrC family)
MIRVATWVVLALSCAATAGCAGAPHHASSAGRRPTTARSSMVGMPGMAGARGIARGAVTDRPVTAAAAVARLVDQHHHTVTLGRLKGRIVVLAPLLSHCGRIDRTTTAQLHQVARTARLAEVGDHVTVLQVSADPAHDRPRRLRAQADRWGPLPNWLLATGRPAALRALWRGVGTAPPTCDRSGRVSVLLLDVTGRVRWWTTGRPGSSGRGGWDADLVDEAVAYTYDR